MNPTTCPLCGEPAIWNRELEIVCTDWYFGGDCRANDIAKGLIALAAYLRDVARRARVARCVALIRDGIDAPDSVAAIPRRLNAHSAADVLETLALKTLALGGPS